MLLNENESKDEKQNESTVENLSTEIEEDEYSTKTEEVVEQKEIEKPTTFWGKVKYFARKYRDYLIAAGITAFIFLFACLVNGAMPFGKKTILISDTYEQVVEFFNHIFNVLQGKSTFFYSNYFGGGVEIFSTIQYMFTNPFYIVVLLGGRSNIILMFTFAILLMLIFNGLVFIWFARKHFSKVNEETRIVLALFYVFSAYINFNFGFITWFVYPSLILFVIDRFLHFFKTQKITSLILILIWYVCACYSVGISTVIVLFILMTASILYLKEKEQRASYLTSLCVVFVVVAMSSIAILFPSIMALLGGGRVGGLSGILVTDDTYFFVKLAPLFFNPFIIIFASIYVIKCKKNDKFNQFLLFTGIMLLLPIVCDTVMKILCFSQYSGFCNRFYFLFEAFIFIAVLLCFEKELFKLNDYKTEKLPKILITSMLVLASITMLLLGIFYYEKLGGAIKNPIHADSGLLKLFFATFACTLFIFLVSMFYYWRKNIGKTMIKSVITFIVVFSLLLSSISFMSNPCSNNSAKKEISQILKDNNITNNVRLSSFSIEYFNFYLEESRHLSYFSSLISSETTIAFGSLGYENGFVYESTQTGLLFSDVMAGVKYYVCDEKQNRPYLKEISKSENFYLYENTLATNGSFVLNSDFSFDDNLTVFENLEKLNDYFEIEGDLFETVEFDKTTYIDPEDDKEKINIKYNAQNNGILYLNRQMFYSNESYCINDFSCYRDIGFIKKDKEYSITANIESEIAENLEMYFLNYDVAEKLCEKINEKKTEFKFNKDGYTVYFELEENQNLYVMIPNIEGLNYELNGKNIEIQETLGGMIKLSSSDLHYVLVAEYNYPHLLKWVVAFIIIAILIAGILLLYHYTKFKPLQKIIDYAMRVVAGAIVVIVYGIGIILSICNFFL